MILYLAVCLATATGCEPLPDVEYVGVSCSAAVTVAAQYAGDHPEVVVKGWRCPGQREARR